MRGEEGGADWGAGVSGVKENQSQRIIHTNEEKDHFIYYHSVGKTRLRGKVGEGIPSARFAIKTSGTVHTIDFFYGAKDDRSVVPRRKRLRIRTVSNENRTGARRKRPTVSEKEKVRTNFPEGQDREDK